MPRNFEYKAKVEDLNSLERTFAHHGAIFVEEMIQTDTYFCVPNGRLKLRESVNKKSELIFYERDESSPSGMQSLYDTLELSDPSLKGILEKSLGVKVVVEKNRRLLKMKNARIHLDEVKYLGSFLEYEVVYEGNEVHDKLLLERLKGMVSGSIIEEINESYSDLLLAKTR